MELDLAKQIQYKAGMAKERDQEAVRRYFKRLAVLGGKAGGPARAKALSPERRSEIAKMGAAAREANREKKKNDN